MNKGYRDENQEVESWYWFSSQPAGWAQASHSLYEHGEGRGGGEGGVDIHLKHTQFKHGHL